MSMFNRSCLAQLSDLMSRKPWSFSPTKMNINNDNIDNNVKDTLYNMI